MTLYTQLPLFALSKICTRCTKEKPVEEFSPHPTGKFGRQSRCKQCHNEMAHEKYIPSTKPKIREASSPEAKVCSKCDKEKSLEEFAPHKRGKYGRSSICRQCIAEMDRARRASRKNAPPTDLPPLKVCTKCKIEKPTEEFSQWWKSWCKQCESEKSHAHYVANREKRLAQTHAYYHNHKEEYKAWAHEYNQRPENKVRKNELSRKYNRTERRRAYNRAYLHRTRAGNPKWQAYDRARYQRNRDVITARFRERNKRPEFKEYRRNYRAAHPEQDQVQAARKRLKYATDQEYRLRTKLQSRTWQKNNMPKVLEYCRRRQARKYGTVIGRVSYTRIRERDGMYCYICEREIAERNEISFDHVIPLARRGRHTEDNIKVAHRICNTRKNARLLSEMTPFDRRGPDA